MTGPPSLLSFVCSLGEYGLPEVPQSPTQDPLWVQALNFKASQLQQFMGQLSVLNAWNAMYNNNNNIIAAAVQIWPTGEGNTIYFQMVTHYLPSVFQETPLTAPRDAPREEAFLDFCLPRETQSCPCVSVCFFHRQVSITMYEASKHVNINKNDSLKLILKNILHLNFTG